MAPLIVVALIAAGVCLFTWITSLVTHEHSWVDRLWSIVPVVYVWVFAAFAGLADARLDVMAVLVTLWGARLTVNFARKGGYTGTEDYRWPILRARMTRAQFAIFNLFFIVIYQNALLVLIALGALTAWQNQTPLGALDVALAALFLLLLVGETIADQQQWNFQRRKAAKQTDQRFVTTGLWRFSRHPNFFFEQAQWWVIFLFGAAAAGSLLQWTALGPLLLTLLFVGSTRFTESITLGRYPEYAAYQATTSAIIPWFAKKGAVASATLGILLLVGCVGAPAAEHSPTPVTPSASPATVGLLHLDPTHDYGDRYADGILPVGDEQWSTSAPSIGSVYLCRDNFVPDEEAGAQTRGPWFINDNTEWDVNAKSSIEGSVRWDSVLAIEISGDQRLIATNDLPTHTTGVFPVSNSDPARFFDANPNTIAAQDLDYVLDAAPTPGAPSCMGGESGVMLTGAALFNAFDAGGRDAGAWEVQDHCDGHPQGAGEYHYHSLSRCIDDVSVTTVIGFALDGFPITGPVVGVGNTLTTNDLDECHGIVSEIELDGQLVESYHYVMTPDFPYSVSCFRGTAAQAPHAEGGQDGPPPPPPGNAPH